MYHFIIVDQEKREYLSSCGSLMSPKTQIWKPLRELKQGETYKYVFLASSRGYAQEVARNIENSNPRRPNLQIRKVRSIECFRLVED